jgi:hypothetical protein
MKKGEDEEFNGYPSWAFGGEWESSPRSDDGKCFTHGTSSNKHKRSNAN